MSSEVELGSLEWADMTMIFTDAHQVRDGTIPDWLNLDRDEELRARTAKSAVHEIGHQLSIGERDDDGGNEVYSGSGEDSTSELVINPRTDKQVSLWSVMSSGLDSEQYIKPTKDTYTAFSIEELMTLELPE